jgi:hypothetical protein
MCGITSNPQPPNITPIIPIPKKVRKAPILNTSLTHNLFLPKVIYYQPGDIFDIVMGCGIRNKTYPTIEKFSVGQISVEKHNL